MASGEVLRRVSPAADAAPGGTAGREMGPNARSGLVGRLRPSSSASLSMLGVSQGLQGRPSLGGPRTPRQRAGPADIAKGVAAAHGFLQCPEAEEWLVGVARRLARQGFEAHEIAFLLGGPGALAPSAPSRALPLQSLLLPASSGSPAAGRFSVQAGGAMSASGFLPGGTVCIVDGLQCLLVGDSEAGALQARVRMEDFTGGPLLCFGGRAADRLVPRSALQVLSRPASPPQVGDLVVAASAGATEARRGRGGGGAPGKFEVTAPDYHSCR